jgi:hypothetical protein
MKDLRLQIKENILSTGEELFTKTISIWGSNLSVVIVRIVGHEDGLRERLGRNLTMSIPESKTNFLTDLMAYSDIRVRTITGNQLNHLIRGPRIRKIQDDPNVPQLSQLTLQSL